MSIEGLNKSKDKKSNFVFKLLLAIFCIIVGLVNYAHTSHMQETNLMFSHLSNLERELSFRTEMGFYYSFYKQIITAFDIRSSLNALINDNLTEYPNTINALQRFNVYPELFVGLLYKNFIAAARSFGISMKTCYMVNRGADLPAVQSCEGLGEPAIFYVNAVMVINGLLMSFMFLIGYLVSGRTLIGGWITCGCYLFNHRECTRVQWTPPLRESFSYPFLVMQQFFLLVILGSNTYNEVSIVTKIGFIMSTLISLLSWQFAQFALLTQCIAIFIAYLIAGTQAKKVITQNIFILLLIVDFANIILQFGNTLLLTGPLTPCIIMAWVIVSMEPNSLSGLRNSVLVPLRWIILIIVLILSTVVLKYIIGSVLQIKSDDHMFDILRSKFTNFTSFDSLLYTCAPEFDFYDMSSIEQLVSTGLLPLALCSMLIIFSYSIFKWFQMLLKTPIDNSLNQLTESGFCEINDFYLFFQTIAYSIMAGLIMRLKLFATPQLCIMAALMCKPNWPLVKLSEFLIGKCMKPSGSHISQTLAKYVQQWPLILIFAICSMKGFENLKNEWSIQGSYSNWDQEQLMNYVMSNTKLTDSFTGQMATMATLRLVTGRPIIIHPHYEDEQLRKKVHIAYSVYSKKPIKEVWSLLRSTLGAKYLIYEHAHCQLRPNNPGCSYLEMWDIEDPNNVGKVPVCLKFEEYVRGMFMNQRSNLGTTLNIYFKWKFTSDNVHYSLFEVIDVPE